MSLRSTLSPVLFALILALLLAAANLPDALAHRVNIFAYVDGATIRAECSFSGGNKARNSLVEVLDAQTGALLGSARTDESGNAALSVSQAMQEAQEGVVLRLKAGEGHQNTWTLSREELAATPAVPATDPAPAPAAPQAVPAPARADSQAANEASGTQVRQTATRKPADETLTLTRAELQALLDERLENKIAPLRHLLAEQASKGPSLQDIVGGLGWILGLFGIAALARSRR